MENTAHSFTEAAEYTPENNPPKKHGLFNLYMEHLDVTMALENLLKLHEREAAGDETITMKEWNAAITACKAVLNNATN